MWNIFEMNGETVTTQEKDMVCRLSQSGTPRHGIVRIRVSACASLRITSLSYRSEAGLMSEVRYSLQSRGLGFEGRCRFHGLFPFFLRDYCSDDPLERFVSELNTN